MTTVNNSTVLGPAIVLLAPACFFACSSSPDLEGLPPPLPEEMPMVLSIADAGDYPASAVVMVDEVDGRRWVQLNVQASAPGGQRDPSVDVQLNPEVARAVLPADGAVVELGLPTSRAAYVVGDTVVYRRFETLSMTVDGGRVEVRIGLGEVTHTEEGSLESPLDPTAEVRLFGQLLLSCSPLGPDGGNLEDASWSSDFCRAAVEDFQLDALLASR
jgi:hypothetical protein